MSKCNTRAYISYQDHYILNLWSVLSLFFQYMQGSFGSYIIIFFFFHFQVGWWDRALWDPPSEGPSGAAELPAPAVCTPVIK